MSDATPTSGKKAAKGWTDTEKLGLLFQIIEKAGTIPWATIELPEGRTVKACSVMVDKEKAKVRKAKEAAAGEVTAGEADGEEGDTPATPATPATATKGKGKKRAATDEATPSASAKKPRAPRKSKKTVTAEADADAEEPTEDGDDAVKDESFE